MIDDYGNNVIILEMPSDETVTLNEDGSHTIFLNVRLTDEAMLRAYNHALYHINNGDFYKSNVQTIEAEAHRGG